MSDLIVFFILLVLGYVVGQSVEKRHYRSLRLREAHLNRIVAIATKFVPEDLPVERSRLVTGSAVISVDFFKRFVAGLRNLVGGRVSSYESLIDRARREAILRMKEEARQMGAQMVFNVKMETASIYKGRKNNIGSVEVLAYGTAIVRPRTS